MTGAGRPFISKSRYMQGLQCPKLLWYSCNRREEIPAPDASTQARFDAGHEVGELAHQLAPGTLLLRTPGMDTAATLAATREALGAGRPLAEAAFMHGSAYAQLDLLVPAADGAWDVWEVKSSTKAKPVHADDLAFQRYVLEGAGVPVRSWQLLHLDNGYVRCGEVDPRLLFGRADLTERTAERQGAVPVELGRMEDVAALAEPPAMPIGTQCNAPYECPLIPRCWDFRETVPDHVTTLVHGGERVFTLLRQGITTLGEIRDDERLDRNQRIQVEAARSGRPHVEPKPLAAFLERLRYPLHFLDFETWMSAVPQLDATRPYQQIPFQFSLHVQESPGAEPRHVAWLADGPGDPRPAFLAALAAGIGPAGSIVAYNARFETGVLSNLVRDLACAREVVNPLLPRFVDLLAPFKNFHLYHPAQHGSASLKHVLPAFTGRGYGEMPIGDGLTASDRFLRLVRDGVEGNEAREKVRRDLLEYCGLDTEAMVRLVAVIREAAEKRLPG